MEKEISNKNFVVISDWMISDFNFSTRELILYAIIYGFSQDGESTFSGSLNYLSQWLGIRRDNVLRYLNSLVENGVVIKEKKNTATKNWCEYKVCIDKGTARDSDHIIISPWMIKDLGLKDKELILYALIHGFSRVGSNSYFSGNNTYMAKWLGIDKSNVKRYTSSLIKKGLIQRIDENNTFKYLAIPQSIKNVSGGHFEYTLVKNEKDYGQNEYTYSHIENTPGQVEDTSMVKLSNNNILNNINNNINNNILNNNKNISNSLFVVNKKLLNYEFDISEKEIFNFKIKIDNNFLTEYKEEKWIIKFLSTISDQKFRYFLAYDLLNNNNHFIIEAESFLLSVLSKYKNYVMSCDASVLIDIYNNAVELFSPDYAINEIIDKKAYLVGIVKNCLKL